MACIEKPHTVHDARHTASLGAFISSLSVKGTTKSSQAHDRDLQFGKNETINIGKSQRLRKEGNARINKVSAM
jgi:hypothetical protein